MDAAEIGLWGVPLAILGGAIRVSTPFIFVSLGEAITERSGRINLGLEGTLVFGAMTAYAVAVMTGSPWLACSPPPSPASASACSTAGSANFESQRHRHRHRTDAVRLGAGLFFGKPFIKPKAPTCRPFRLAPGRTFRRCRRRSTSTWLFLIGAALAVFLWWAFRNTRSGLIVRVVGDSSDAARAMGLNPDTVRLLATASAGRWPASAAPICRSTIPVAGPSASRRARADGGGAGHLRALEPARLLCAALLSAGRALGPALESVGVTQGYYLF